MNAKKFIVAGVALVRAVQMEGTPVLAEVASQLAK